jgi:ribonuclease T1
MPNRRSLFRPLALLGLLLVAAIAWQHHEATPPASLADGAATSRVFAPARSADADADADVDVDVDAPDALPDFLPPQARDTLARIAHGGPFAHRQDGAVFGNREHLLPAMPRGYYHEYTVETPGLDYRGARRIISGGTPPVVYYYTDDHYRSFGLDRSGAHR